MGYILAANCIITNGAKRSLLYDYQRLKSYLLSLEIAKKLSSPIISKDDFIGDGEYKMFEFLLQEDILINIYEEKVDNFLPISHEYHTPHTILDAVIDYTNIYHDIKLFHDLIECMCLHIELRFFEKFNIDYFFEVQNAIQNSCIERIDLYINYIDFIFFEKNLLTVVDTNARLGLIYVYACPADLKQGYYKRESFLFTSQPIKSENDCGCITPQHFTGVFNVFFESQKYNTCLNKKIGISATGNIKNCPSMKKSFGKVESKSIIEALNDPSFKEVWHINKNKINICKDCEFRNICTDCRAYVESPDDLFSKPLKCGYNPYICEWNDWESDMNKINAITYYNF